MKIKDKFSCLLSILKCKFLKKRMPIAVRWQLTNRCTLKCKYCNLWRSKSEELTFNQICSILDELSSLGTKRISFSGGEPLLREEISEILRYCRSKNIYPEMNSNGTLVASQITRLKALDFLKLSLDGPEEVHDFLRGKGSYHKVTEAADGCLRHGIKFGFATTLTRYNIETLDFVLEIAKKYNTIVAFQPLKRLYRNVENISELSPEEINFKKAIKKLVQQKISGNKNIRNSLIGLEHIYNWPKYKRLKCWPGKIFCIIDTNGNVYPCDRIRYDQPLPNCTKMDFQDALNMLPDVYCDGCGFCGSLELNYLMSFKFEILNSIKKIIY